MHGDRGEFGRSASEMGKRVERHGKAIRDALRSPSRRSVQNGAHHLQSPVAFCDQGETHAANRSWEICH